MWAYQMMFFAERGYRAIAFDRRGFGRSSQPWTGYDYDTFADDIAQLMEKLALDNVLLAGFSMGGGDIVRYIARHGSSRVAKLALISAVTPLFGRAADYAEGVDLAVFEGIRAGLRADHAQFLLDFGPIFFGTNRSAAAVSPAVLQQTQTVAMLASIKATVDCVTAFSETDFRPDMAKIDVPTLVIHGDDDQVVPSKTTGEVAARMIAGAILKIYPGAPHATTQTHKDQLNADLLTFFQS
jgi:pimeloyl-ACP methyl ester carboxylesterase